ncbi:hypothetical protein [Falsiroseomonas tokyonensis]|uniref:Uncharacterized protein n=1 Tax=Falsiroseomonas tokyonensis TaxID=430521 RepID=A0ABV7C0L9_9PROT|nr:hypothetical protein [Falsiroseomonas tokyonensis]MBU8540209.1 hypothetical protein [Falsiroseomonas tokyonensis]
MTPMQSDPAAPAWPDDVVDLAARAMMDGVLWPGAWDTCTFSCADTERGVWRQNARAALAAIAPWIAAERAAAELRGIERAERAAEAHAEVATSEIKPGNGMVYYASGATGAASVIRALPPSDPAAASALAELLRRAVEEERERIIEAVRDEADTTPCDEDAKVVEDVADLIEADFNYEAAEAMKRVREGEDDAAIRARGDGGAA